MPVNMTIKNIPTELYDKLKESASRNRRSLNGEVIYCLENMFASHPTDPDAFLARLAILRARVSDAPLLTDKIIRKAREEGRP